MNLTRKQTGFTLIEILLIVIIMSILTTSAYGGILNLQRTSRVNSIIRQFSSYLEIARSYAINGKLVNEGCESGQKMCVPKSFGVIVRENNSSCADSGKRSVDLFYQKTTAQNFSENNLVTLDFFCVNPAIEFWYDKAKSSPQKYAKDIHFAYTPPFGTFSTTNQEITPESITLSFCETSTDANAKSCDPKTSYTKVLTLYTNAGVLE